MPEDNDDNQETPEASPDPVVKPEAASTAAPSAVRPDEMPKELDGPKGPEPTRFGDWEKGGRCSDF